MMCFGLKDRKRLKTNHCVIVLLDDTQLVHELHTSSTGQDLLDVVIKHLNLLETSYFGLRYFDRSALDRTQEQQLWLEVDKSAIKQLNGVQPMTVYFGVKYYAPDPCKLAEEITRYQFFLQCKQDILHGRLQIPFDLAVELFALAVQSELGDFDPARHLDGYVSEFQFLAKQTIELEKRVALFHRNLSGQVPATAELNFLERVKWLDLYGCELHPIEYEDSSNDEYALGLNPAGVLVLRNKLKVALYLWPRIIKSKCQGRCFLMDVIEAKATTSGQQLSTKQILKGRNRFGFRLSDKVAACRLKLSVEEHKSFHQLIIHSSSSSHRRQQQQLHQTHLKLSQRFRNSIRSAINVGSSYPASSSSYYLHPDRLHSRSSMKSLHNQQHNSLNGHDSSHPVRSPPNVVRTPSRRYKENRTALVYQQQLQQQNSNLSNGLPSAPHTMLDSERQQALMMISQFNQMLASKSQTLKPSSNWNKGIDSKDAKSRNPYYQLMMMMAANQQQQQEIAVLAPGRHIVQPSIYKATSVVNGINQLGGYYATNDPAPPALYRGHESPRSTRSARIGSSMKLASKQRAQQQQQQQQQQQILYDNRENFSPTASDSQNRHLMSASANPSPRSIRSARITQRHKSKSIVENLNLLSAAPGTGDYANNNQQAPSSMRSSHNNKMLLTTAAHLAPPVAKQRHFPFQATENGELGRNQIVNESRRYALDANQAMLLNSNGFSPEDTARFRIKCGQQVARLASTRNGLTSDAEEDEDEDDDYCYSKSECSSNSDAVRQQQQQQQQRRNNNIRQPSNGEVQQSINRQVQCNRSNAGIISVDDQKEWHAIRKRHNEFLLSGSFNNQQDNYNKHQQTLGDINNNNNNNNNSNNNITNSNSSSQLIKNIASKQATPILLSMNYERQVTANANDKAIQLLNLQRQQLNSQSSDNGTKSTSSLVNSSSSSVASSPQQYSGASGGNQQAQISNSSAGSHSTSSTTSGYYAGSNSTGSIVVDSDNGQGGPSQSINKPEVASKENSPTGSQAPNDPWQEGSRAKIALGSYSSRIPTSRSVLSEKQTPKSPNNSETEVQLTQKQKQQQPKQQFYLGDPVDIQSASPADSRAHWSPLNQTQHQTANLKYVSFDV